MLPYDDKHSCFRLSIQDLLLSPVVQSMNGFIQHGDITCLEHCLFVSYTSFSLCRSLGLNAEEAARGALLHDLFLYDWHDKNAEYTGLHGFSHPKTALHNAEIHFDLTTREKDMIVKHMWPLTLRVPRYRESFIVGIADKFCAVLETTGLYKKQFIHQNMDLLFSKQ